MAAVKFMARQRDHFIPTLVCVIQFTLGTTYLTVNVSNFLATLFWQLLTLALMSLTVRVTHFLLPIRMQKCHGVNMHNIFQSNLHIATCNSLSRPPAGIHHNQRIVAHSSLSCRPTGNRHNQRITARSFLSCPPASIRRNQRIATRNFLSCPSAGICHN